MQHIPVVSHVLSGGTCGPCRGNTWLIPSTGGSRVYLQRERSLSGPGEDRDEERARDAEVSH